MTGEDQKNKMTRIMRIFEGYLTSQPSDYTHDKIKNQARQER
jgi:hypothetical protein